jgi:hypothetical protein
VDNNGADIWSNIDYGFHAFSDRGALDTVVRRNASASGRESKSSED